MVTIVNALDVNCSLAVSFLGEEMTSVSKSDPDVETANAVTGGSNGS